MSPYAHVMEAIQANNQTAALAAVAELGPMDIVTPQGSSPVLEALYRDMDGVPSALVQKGYHPSLIEAAAMGDVEQLNAQLAVTAPTDVYSDDGWTPLHLAAFLGRTEAVKALLAFNADHGAISRNATANQPLHAAIAGRGDSEAINALIDAGADVCYAAGGGWTPLHLAASRGNIALCEKLVENGADPAARSNDGKTAADLANERGHAALADALKRGSA